MRMIKNMIFDMGNVVVRWDPEAILKHFTADPKQIEILKEVIFRSKEWLMLDQGILNEKEVTEILCKRLETEELKEQCKEILKHGLKYMPVFPETEKWIQQLKQNGYSIYVLSNTSKVFYEYIQKQPVWQYFDGAILSYQEKLVKPDPRIYEVLCQRYQLIPQECCFFDDRKENIDAAISYGMKGFVFEIQNIKELKEKVKQVGI